MFAAPGQLQAAQARIGDERANFSAPCDLAGGEPGRCGRNWVDRAGGAVHEMGGQDHCPVAPGDVLVLETLSGGRYGTLAESGPDIGTG